MGGRQFLAIHPPEPADRAGDVANPVNQYTLIDSLAAPAYDADGNTTSIQFPPVGAGSASAVWSYQYDAQNRLIGGTDGTHSFSFAYDARSRCVARTIDGTTTANLYDRWSLIEERTATDTELAHHLHGAALDEVLCTVTASGKSPTPRESPLHTAIGD
jgi:YD repeat-containing protein